MNFKNINTVIIDDNKESCRILSDYLSSQKDIIVTGMAHDGLNGLRLISNNKPDLVILDVIMPHLDGLGILETLDNLNITPRPKIIVLSAVGLDNITQRALSLGADYYVLKPYDMETFINSIYQMFDNADYNLGIPETLAGLTDAAADQGHRRLPSIEEQISDILHVIGIPANIKGYHYLREAIALSVNIANKPANITKDIYPTIAEKFNVLQASVEKAIEAAIEKAFSRGDVETMAKLFGVSTIAGKRKPTNGHFIATITDMLRLRNKVS